MYKINSFFSLAKTHFENYVYLLGDKHRLYRSFICSNMPLLIWLNRIK